MKKLLPVTAIMLSGLMLLSACNAATGGETPAASSAPEAAQSAAPAEQTPAEAQPTGNGVITLDGDSAVCQDPGVTCEKGKVTIASPGTYTLTGSFSGQIFVNSQTDGLVELVLSNASITKVDEAAIYVEQADDFQLTIPKDTVNTLSATGAGLTETDADGNISVVGAALYSKDDMTIDGEGSLTVSCEFNNGIHCKDDLTICGSVIDVTADNNGIKGKDSVTITGGVIKVTSGGDAIQSNNDTDVDKGYIDISGGTIDLTSDKDGISAVTDLTVSGGVLNIVTGGGYVNAKTKSEDFFGSRPGQTTTNTTDEATVSIKGLKAGANLNITGGDITIDACDDALHSNGIVTITGGVMNLASGDDGIHGTDATTIEAGDVTITHSYEGIEGKAVLVSGGNINVTSSDDGFNAAGGNDGGMGGFFGTDSFSESGSSELRITGGVVIVNADGDGLDSNGLLSMEGGEVYVDGPTNRANGALDSGSGAVVTGGTLVAVGHSGMAENFDSDSTQCSMLYCFDETLEAGSLITVTDSTGNTIMEYSCKKSCNSIVFTSPALKQGETYTFTSGDQTGSLELTSVIASNGGMGFGFGFGGPGGRPR